MDYLNFNIDGKLVRETDLSVFRTESALRAWQKRCAVIYTAMNGEALDVRRIAFSDQIKEFTNARRDELRAEEEARKLNSPARNLNLIVNPNGVKSFGMRGKTAAEVLTLLDCFDDASQMTDYEFAAYECFTEDQLDEMVVETLYDLFGTEFATTFYRRKNILIAKHDLHELLRERAILNGKIAVVEAKIARLEEE